jgi:hypothetical protein
MKTIKISSVVFTLLVCSVGNAGIISEVVSAGNCSTAGVQITSMISVAPVGGEIVAAPINSTSCLGFVTTPENDWGNGPSPNKGGLEDGLLNGEIKLIGSGKPEDKDGYYVPGEQFLTNENDSMVDLNGDGIFDDPGWIRLGGAETKTVEDWDFEYDSIGALSLIDLITMSLSDDGTWSLGVDPSAIAAVTDELGRATVFDHLAFVLKGSNNDPAYGTWVIYDFNFHDLIDDGLDVNLNQAYNIAGTWDKNMFSNDNALSHVSIWAHDPPVTFDVPEPSTLTIFTLGMIGLVSRRFRKQS